MQGKHNGPLAKGKIGSGKKPKNSKKTIKRIFSYMLEQKFLLILVVFLILISSLASVVGTYLIRPVINVGIIPIIGTEITATSFLPLIRILVFMGIIYILGSISSYAYSRIMLFISNKTLNSIRKDLFDKMQDLPISFFDKHTHGELMSYYTNDIDTLRETLNQSVTQFITSAITLISTFIMMLILSPILTVLIIVMIFVMVKVAKFIGGKSAKYFRTQQEAVGQLNGYVEENIEGIKVIKVFSHEDECLDKFEVMNEKLRIAATNANIYGSIIMPIMGNISYFNYALTAILGSILSINGLMDIGAIASYLQYTRSFSQPITQISQLLNSIFAAIAGAERIFSVIDEKSEYGDELIEYNNEDENPYWVLSNKSKINARGEVVFENVKFGYTPEKIVIKNLSIHALPGEKIALVGSTGAGKTTITNLINRFYDIQDGKISIDGIDINNIKKDELRKSLAMVLQDTHLFTGSVMENIRYGRLDATDEEVIEAAKLANAHSFVKHLPEGYDTVLESDGANLSQGQRQLLNIARAAIANPEILILDEATSSVDTRTEMLIENGLNKLMKGRTVFIIAHRLSTVRNCDNILVLEQGEVIESGNHNQLLDKKGKYYQLYTGQIELD